MNSSGASSSAGSSGTAAEAALPPGFIPPGMICCLDGLDTLVEPLRVEETPGTERMAPVRLREFVAGRTAARRALRRLTGLDLSVPRNPDRTPAWPEGLCGSLSHSRRYAICVVARRADHPAIGVDIEEDSRLDQTLWSHVMTRTELAWLAALPIPQAEQTATLLFSAKEAYFKCLPRHLLEPALLPESSRIETSVDFNAATFTCSVPPEKKLPVATGRFTHFDHHWLTLTHLPRPPLA